MTHNYYLITPPLQVPLKIPQKFSWRRGPDMLGEEMMALAVIINA